MSDPARARLDERRPRGRRSFAFDLALALLATAAELAQVIGATGPPRAPALVLAVVAGGALVLRRTAPLAVLATTLAATVAIVALDDDPSGVSVLIALYTTAALCERRVSLAALASTAAIAATLSAVTADAPGRETSAWFGAIIVVMLTVGIWALGAYAQTQRRYRRELQERAASAEREREQLARIAVHEERASIARELHDIVAHSVSVMLVGVRGARDVLRTSPDAADETLARVERSGEQSLAELRRILALLREPEQRARVAPAALARRAERTRRELPRSWTARTTGGDRRTDAAARRRRALRLPHRAGGADERAQALRPDQRHGDTRVSRLRPRARGRGRRHDGHTRRATTGQGLVGMRERVALLGGELQTGPREGGGFRVAARLPVGGDA